MTKPTKRDYFNRILPKVADEPELVDFIKHELELINRKNASRSDKPTANQVANASLMDTIFEAMVEGKPYTVTEIQKSVPALAEFSTNKVSALMRGLKLDGRVLRSEEKGKAYFTKA